MPPDAVPLETPVRHPTDRGTWPGPTGAHAPCRRARPPHHSDRKLSVRQGQDPHQAHRHRRRATGRAARAHRHRRVPTAWRRRSGRPGRRPHRGHRAGRPRWPTPSRPRRSSPRRSSAPARRSSPRTSRSTGPPRTTRSAPTGSRSGRCRTCRSPTRRGGLRAGPDRVPVRPARPGGPWRDRLVRDPGPVLHLRRRPPGPHRGVRRRHQRPRAGRPGCAASARWPATRPPQAREGSVFTGVLAEGSFSDQQRNGREVSGEDLRARYSEAVEGTDVQLAVVHGRRLAGRPHARSATGMSGAAFDLIENARDGGRGRRVRQAAHDRPGRVPASQSASSSTCCAAIETTQAVDLLSAPPRPRSTRPADPRSSSSCSASASRSSRSCWPGSCPPRSPGRWPASPQAVDQVATAAAAAARRVAAEPGRGRRQAAWPRRSPTSSPAAAPSSSTSARP